MNASLQCSSSNAQSVSTHAKHNSTASSKKRKGHLEPSVPLRAQFEQDFTAKRRRPHPSRKRANFSPQRKLCLPEKNTMFRAIPNIQIASMIRENEAFVRGILQILQLARVEEVKTTLSCEASFKLYDLKRNANDAVVRGFLPIPRHVPTGLKDLLRYVLTRLQDLLRHVLTRLQDLLRHVAD